MNKDQKVLLSGFLASLIFVLCLFVIEMFKTPEQICANKPQHLINDYCKSLITRNSNSLPNQKE